MRSAILHCPELERDVNVTALLRRVPDAGVHVAPLQKDGCLRGHQEIVRGARRAGLDRVWVLEDDAALLPSFDRARWEADAEWANAHGYGVLLGACAVAESAVAARPGLVEVVGWRSAHCIVYFRAGMDAVLRIPRRPFDMTLGHAGVRAVVTVPFVAHQRAGVSANVGRHVDYTAIYQKQEQRLLRLGAT